MRHDATERLVDGGVIAVLRGVDADDVVHVARAAVEGGVRAVEVTADTPGAMDMIAAVADDLGDVALVGAGTVLDAETAVAAHRAGAEFVVSPSVHADVIEACNRHGLVVVPGAATPTEAVEAYEAGADVVKLFLRHLESVRDIHCRDLEAGHGRTSLPYSLARKYPNAPAEWLWQYVFPAAPLGPDYLAALDGPLSQIPFVPTGGVDAGNAGDFVEAGAVAVAAGGAIVDRAAIDRGDYETVTERARELVEAVEAAR